jgi:hypothetical protein
VDASDLGEAINFEELMAEKGYRLGELGDLESSGWARTVLGPDGEPYDLT